VAQGKAGAWLAPLGPGGAITSEQFQRLLRDHGITCSMSRAGNVWDNSAMESVRRSLEPVAFAAHSHR
jgi:putative transposase